MAQVLEDLAVRISNGGPTYDTPPDGWYWIAPLCACGVLNAVFYLSSAARDRVSGKRADRWSRVLAAIYVFVCAYRSVFMTDTHARLCFTDTVFNGALVNRTLAAVAEVSFGVLGVVTLRDVGLALLSADPRAGVGTRGNGRGFAELYLSVVLVPLGTVLSVGSNVCSHYGTITRWSLPLILEECGWFVYASACALGALLVLAGTGGWSGADAKPEIVNVRRILKVLAFGSVVFAVYLAVEDIPMYIRQYRREQDMSAAQHAIFTLSEGVRDAMRCYRVSRVFSDWRGVWLWQTLYFIFGPLSVSLQLRVNRLMRTALNLSSADDEDGAGSRKKKAL